MRSWVDVFKSVVLVNVVGDVERERETYLR